MKKDSSFLLKQYAKMSGDKKVRIGMDWSNLVREVNNEGKKQTLLKTYVRNRPKGTP